MKKQKKQLILLLILTIILICGYFSMRGVNAYLTEKEKQQEESSKIMVMDMTAEDVLSMSYCYEGERYTFKRNEEEWIYAADESIDVKESVLDGMAGHAAQIEASEIIEEVSNLEQYGLSEPSNEIEIVTEQRTYTIYAGNYNEIIGKNYIYIDNPSTVYVVSTSVVDAFEKGLDDVIAETTSVSGQ